jgi:flagellar biosynthesis protein FlhA
MSDAGNAAPTATPQAGAARGFNLNKVVATLRRGEILFALGIMAVLTVLIFPMPAWLLDISLAFSITVPC